MPERKRAEIHRRIDPKTLRQLPFDGRPSLEKRRIWELTERSLSYEGIEGRILSYSDGTSDILFFTDFPSGEKRKKLWRSIRSLKRQNVRGRYEVKAKEGAEKAEIRLFYVDPKYLKKDIIIRFNEIWRDLMTLFSQKPGLVVLGEVVIIKDFISQNLLVEDQ